MPKRSGSDVGPPTGEPSAKRIRETTLKVAPDDIDAAAHARMDAAVIGGAEEPATPLHANVLLAAIVYNSEGRLNPEYGNPFSTKILFERHPELMDMLRDAWTAGEFKEIRNLSVYILVLVVVIHDE